jgi:hypothetical protein
MACDLTYIADKEAQELASKIIDGQRVVTNLYVKYLTRKDTHNLGTFAEFLKKSYPDRLRQYNNLTNKRITLPNRGSDTDILTMYQKDKSQYIDVSTPKLEGGNWVYYILKPKDYFSILYPEGQQLSIDLNPDFKKKKDVSQRSDKTILQKLEYDVLRLQKQLSNAKDRTKKEAISNRLSKAEEKLKTLEKEENISEVLKIAKDDLETAESLLTNPNITENDLYNIKRVTDFWMDQNLLGDLFDIDDLNEGSEATEVFLRLRNRALIADKNWKNVVYKRIKDIVEKQTNKSYSETEWENMLGNMKDISLGQALFRDMSSVDNVIVQVADKIIKEANTRAELEAGVIIKQIDRLVDKIRGKVGVKFNLYQQLDSKGRPNGNLVYRFAQKFFDAAKGTKPRDWSKKDQVVKYKTWKKDNMLVFDYRKLFYNEYKDLFYSEDTFTSKEIEDSLNELKTALGEKGYNFYLKKATEKWNDFKQRHATKKAELETEFNGDDSKVNTALYDWEAKYSPINYIKDVYERTSIFNKNNPRYQGFEYILEVPKRFQNGKDTGYYDKNFEKIEGDSDLLEFYNYLTEKLEEFKSFYPKDVTEGLQENFIPDLPRTMLENLSSIKGLGKGLFNTLIDSISQEEFYHETVDESGRKNRSLPVFMMGKSRYSTLTDGEMVALKQEARAKYEPGSQAYIDYYKQRKDEIIAEKVKSKSFDLGTILKALALTSLTYKHKSDVEDSIRLINVLVNDAAEIQIKPDGTPETNRWGMVTTKEGQLSHLRSAFEYMMDTFYGKTKNVKESNKKLYKWQEKQTKTALEAEIKKIESSVAAGEITKEEGDADIAAIKKDIDKLGQSFVWSKAWDLLGKYMHVKGMGWNLFSATTNYLVALAGNYTFAARGREFGTKEMAWAYTKLKHSLLSNVGASTAEGQKITNLLGRMQVGKSDKDTIYGNKTLNRYKNTPAGKALSIILPYELTQRVEFLNQGATALAMLKKEKIENLKGEKKSLYDAFDQDGNWKTDEFGEDQGWDLTGQKSVDYILKVQNVIKQIHGNYDPNSATLIKKTALGRQLMMFRNWIPEGIATRFEPERESVIMGEKTKGRYRSYKVSHLAVIPLAKDYIKALKGEYTKGTAEDAALDSANLKRNVRELLIYGVSLAGILALRGIKDDDDEEKGIDTYLLNFYLNSFTRLQTDLEFFISPIAAEKITRNSLPIAQLITDLALWVKAVRRYLDGRDGENGAYTLEQRTWKIFPGGSVYYTTKNLAEKEY